MKIYTKTGDEGTTGLLGGERILKSDVRMDAIGTVDELNASLGWCAVANHDSGLASQFRWIQARLFDLGAELALPADSTYQIDRIGPEEVSELESDIDRMDAELPALRNFILPGGSELGARLHFTRSVCRRAERDVVALHAQHAISHDARTFLNRLSDWLFTAARFANLAAGVEEEKWSRKSTANASES